MASQREAVEQRHFSVEEYHRMAEAGVLSPDERVELVRGVVRSMSPKNRAHVIAATRIFVLLTRELEERASVYKEDPLILAGLDSEPEPDIVVCSNPAIGAYGTARTAPILVIEVAESSLGYDLGEKAALYADAGIREYWVVNLVDGALEVFREPRGGAYQTHESLAPGARVAPEAWPDLSLEVDTLLDTSTG